MKLYTDLVAIDIGTGSIKAAAVNASGPDSYQVASIDEEPLLPGLVGGDFTNPFISDIPLFKTIFTRVLKKLGGCRGGVIVGLPDRWVKLHLNKSVLTDQEKRSSDFFSWRLAKTLPIPEGMPVKIDSQILSEVEGEEPGTCRILAAAVKTDIIEILSRITTDLDVEVMAFDTSSLGVFNVFEGSHPESVEQKMIIHVHIGHETTVVRAYDNGILMYERVIEVAGQEFTKIISELDGVNLDVAAATKRTEKYFPVVRADMEPMIAKRSRIEAIFGNWFRELNVTFRFFQDKYRVSAVPEIIMTGGGAMFPGLDRFVGEFLGTTCKAFNPFENMTFDKGITEDMQRKGSVFACSIGLLAK